MQILKEFQDKFIVNGSRSLKMELVGTGNYVGINANASCLIVVMSDQQLKGKPAAHNSTDIGSSPITSTKRKRKMKLQVGDVRCIFCLEKDEDCKCVGTSINCEICNNPKPSLHDKNRCLICGGKIYYGPNLGKLKKVAAASVFEIEVWNKAIEAAALHCDEMGEEARISENIRGLKK